MSHRAAQIIDAIVTRLQSSTTLGVNAQNIFAHRTLSLAENQDELPAVTVNFGEDEPGEYTMLDGSFSSTLEIFTKAYVVGEDETAARQALLTIRAETHKAIDLRQTLGLSSFVLKVGYGGASAPELDTEGELCVGAQESHWLVTYFMNPADPS